MKGIILAGGTGSRLSPLTKVTNKHLLPVYDKPMILHPIENLLSAGITDILIVTGGESVGDFLRFLGSGKDRGCRFTYKYQDGAGGIPVALELAKEFVGDDKCVVILGDNIFDDDLKPYVESFENSGKGCQILTKKVYDPERYGVVELRDGKVVSLEEKPKKPKSDLVVIGIYMFDKKCFDIIPTLKPSKRGELEIVDVILDYIRRGDVVSSTTGKFWIDAGTFEGLRIANQHFIGKKENELLKK